MKAALAGQPVASRTGKGEGARRVVEDLVRTRLLAHLAEEKGYHREPEFVRRYAEQLAALYLEKEFEQPERARAPADEEVRSYFEAHRSELARPERVRVALISLLAATPQERAAKRAKALAALKEARAREREYYAFGELARTRSEDRSRAARNGELPPLTREELAAQMGPEVAEAAFAMREAGRVRPELIENAAGYHVLKLLGRETAYEPRYEDLRESLRSRLASEWRAERRKAFLEAIWKEADIRIDEAALEKVVADLRAPRK